MPSIITRITCPVCADSNIKEVLVCKDHTVSKENFQIWECSYCKLRFTQAVPDENAIAPYYQAEAYISHTDSEKGLINRLYMMARNYTLNWKVKMVKHTTGKTVGSLKLLDIGAGTGAFVNHATKAGWIVKGLEPDAGARKICLDKYQLQLDSPEKLFEIPANEFDAVTMWHVLEHVHRLQDYIATIKKILKPQGVALIALPNYTSMDAKYYKEYWAAYDVPRHLYHFHPTSIEMLVDQHDMKVEEIKPMWLDAFYIAMLSEQYKNKKSNILSAVVNGLRSNLNAVGKTENCSSLVYIIRNKNV